jgi:hypothetical protein
MVRPRHACFAYGTVLGASRLGYSACPTYILRVVEDVIERVMAQLEFVCLGNDDVRTVRARDLAEVGEYIRPWDEEEGETFLESADEEPRWREEQRY